MNKKKVLYLSSNKIVFMPGKIKNIWNKISNQGVKPEYTLSVQKRIILTNQLAIISFLALFTMSFIQSLEYLKFDLNILLNFLSILSILSVLYINKKGGYKITSVLFSVLTPLFTVFFATLSKRYLENAEVVYYFYTRFLLLAELSIPLILIDFNRKLTLAATVAINLLCLFLYDPIQALFDVDISSVKVLSNNLYYTFNYLIITPVVILLFGFYFLMDLNLKYEKKIFQLVDELTEKNEVLNQQKEEITASLEEISSQKEIIEGAYKIIEQKNKNITDSIVYAKRIQHAALPANDFISTYFKNYFIYYKPRDIVSGDFYWCCEVDNKQIIVAADCTGHGVPGAFVSILGIALFKEVVFLRDIYRPDLILNELRNQVKNTLGQSGKVDENKDGMDLALCQFDFHNKKLYFAGANNPLYQIRNDEFTEIKADRQPIGVYAKEKPFTLNEIDFQDNDLFYIFSDGFTSQFGGEKNEKYKSHRFKDLLLSVANENLENQKLLIDKNFHNWKQNYDQVDDILVIGIKI